MREKFKKLALAILTFAMTFFFLAKISTIATNNEFQLQYDVKADAARIPSTPPIKIIGIWLTSGYDVQPSVDNYTTSSQPVTLYTDAGRSIFAALLSLSASPHYQWYSSDDGLVYTKVPTKDGGTNQNLTVNPTAVGTKYYQQWTDWYTFLSWGPLIDTMAYTNIIKVHVLPDPVNAQTLKVKSDSDYLYNNLTSTFIGIFDYAVADTTQMHATTTPDDATGTVKWYSSDTSIATVDENTGAVSGNTNGVSGTVTITGVYTNPDGSIVKDSTKIRVGGGLDDQTVGVGETATFKLQGSFSSADNVSTSVEWHKVSPDGKTDTVVDKGSNLSYTTPVTTLTDDGSHYYAKIKVSQTTNGSTSTQTGTTNKAKLNVLTKGDPDITQTFEIGNQNTGVVSDSFLDKNMSGDEIDFQETLTNNSTTGTLTNGKLTVPVRKGSTLKLLMVDGYILMMNGAPLQENVNYTKQYNAEKGYDEIVFSTPAGTAAGDALNFNLGQTHTVKAFYYVSEVDKDETLTSAPTISGINSDGESYSSDGPSNTLNFTTGKITLDPSNISFGSHLQQAGSELFDRTDDTNSPNNVLTVDDGRRNLEGQSQIQITSTPLYKETTDSNGNNVVDTNQAMNADLRYYNADGTYTSLSDGAAATVENAISGSPLSSINWAPQEGLRLYVPNGAISGSYEGTVTWTAITSIE